MYGLAGDYNIAIGLLFFRLESFFRVLWYMDQNVEPDETAYRFYFRPWPLAFYRIFWMTMQRPLSFVGRWSLPAFFGTVLLLLMLSLVAPLAFTAAFLLRSFWWYDRYGQLQFH